MPDICDRCASNPMLTVQVSPLEYFAKSSRGTKCVHYAALGLSGVCRTPICSTEAEAIAAWKRKERAAKEGRRNG